MFWLRNKKIMFNLALLTRGLSIDPGQLFSKLGYQDLYCFHLQTRMYIRAPDKGYLQNIIIIKTRASQCLLFSSADIFLVFFVNFTLLFIQYKLISYG